jgi:methyl-accepting chemotaxis protein
MNKISIKLRLLLGFGFILVMMIAITVIGARNVAFIDNKMEMINEVNAVKQRYAINFRGSVHDRAIAIRDVVLFENQQDVQSVVEEIRALEVFYQESSGPLDNIMSKNASSEEREILSAIKDVEKKTLPLVEQIIDLQLQHNMDEANSVLLTRARPAFTEWLAVINQFIDLQEEKNVAETVLVRERSRAFSGVMFTATSISVVFGLIIVTVVVVNLSRSLGGEPHDIVRILGKMADGDLSQNFTHKNECSVLGSLEKMQSQLRRTIAGIHEASSRINLQTDTASQGSTELVDFTTRQRQLVDSATSKLDDVKAINNAVSSILTETEKNSGDTLSSSVRGNSELKATESEIRQVLSVVSAAVEKIQQLEQRTRDIGGITNVISEISDQTNLLALNAAIEAARAGELGRGFAVVADEVRNLAARTGEATSEIEVMLSEVQRETGATMQTMESSLPQIERGLELTVNSSQLLQDIEHQANSSSGNVRQVVDASTHQVEAIDYAATQIKEASSTADEMASAANRFLDKNQEVAEELNALAQKLKQHADYFSLT